MGVATAALLFSDRMIRATAAESSNPVKELADRMQRFPNQTPEAYVPPAQEMERTMKLVQELENPSTSFRYGPKETQGTSREGTSQTAEETHQEGQDKGTEHRTSSQEQMERMRAVMEELKANPNPNPELRERARKMLAESRQLTEHKSSETERRRLDTPDKQCLDISHTQINANHVRGVANPDGYGLELDIQGVLQNNCGSQVSDVHYNMNVQLDCPSGSYDPGIAEPFNFKADYASFPQGRSYSVTSSARQWI